MFKGKVFKVILSFFIVSCAILGFVKINIINTKALSPLGTTSENYDLVHEEFGEDFSNFIQDKSPIKIYVEEDKETMVRIGETDFIIKSESTVTNFINEMFQSVKNLF